MTDEARIAALLQELKAANARADKAENMVADAYQFAGNVLDIAGIFHHPEAQRALDYFAGLIADDDFRWPSVTLESPYLTRVKELEAELKRVRDMAEKGMRA